MRLHGIRTTRALQGLATAAATAMAGLWAVAGSASSSVSPFSFRSIEFAEPEQRLPAAERYLHDYAAPGTPLPAAIAAIRRAEAGCRKQPAPDGAIRCYYAAGLGDSTADMPLGDVTWTINIYPTADGRVASTSVSRERFGR